MLARPLAFGSPPVSSSPSSSLLPSSSFRTTACVYSADLPMATEPHFNKSSGINGRINKLHETHQAAPLQELLIQLLRY